MAVKKKAGQLFMQGLASPERTTEHRQVVKRSGTPAMCVKVNRVPTVRRSIWQTSPSPILGSVTGHHLAGVPCFALYRLPVFFQAFSLNTPIIKYRRNGVLIFNLNVNPNLNSPSGRQFSFSLNNEGRALMHSAFFFYHHWY